MLVIAAQFRGWRRLGWIVPVLLAGLVAGCGRLPSRLAATLPGGSAPRREKDFVSAR